MVNKCIFIGNLGADPEVNTTSSGKEVANFSLAVRAGKDGTEWIRVVAWERQAEIAERFLKKGSRAYVEGELRTRSWEDSEGNKRYTTECIARLVLSMNSREEREADEGGSPI